jgi:hypothetical protein
VVTEQVYLRQTLAQVEMVVKVRAALADPQVQAALPVLLLHLVALAALAVSVVL